MIQDDETKEFKIYFNPKTKLWESEREMLARVRRRHIRMACFSICTICLANLISHFSRVSRGAMVISGILLCIAAIVAIIMALENLKLAEKAKQMGERDAYESR